MNNLRKVAVYAAVWLISAHPALALNDTIAVTAGVAGKTANLISFAGGNVISEVGICDATTANQCASVSAGGALLVTGTGGTFPVTGTLTAVTAITNALPAGANVIGHVIADTGSTTAVTQATAGNLNATVVGTGTFAVQAASTLAAETTKVIGTVRNLGNAGGIFDGATAAAVPANALQVGMAQGGNLIAMTGTSGNLNVQCANCSGSGVSTADEATFTAGASLFAGAGGFFQTTATNNALTNGQQGMWQMTANRAGFVNLRTAAGAEIGVAAAPVQVSLANTAANGTAVTVGGTVTANAGTNLNTSLLALETGGNLASIKTDTDRLLSSATNIVAGSALATTSFVVGTRYLSTPPTFTNGQEGALQIDSAGRLIVNVGAGGAGGGAVTMASGAVSSGAYSSGAFASGSFASGSHASGSFASGAYASGSIASGAMVDLGAQADAACTTDTGTCSLIALAKRGNQNMAGSIPAGSAIIGKVGIDQTTPGTTNGVALVGVNGATALAGNGNTGTGSARITIATDNSALPTWGHVAVAAAPPSGATYIGALGSGATGGHVAAPIICDNHVFKHITSATDTLAVQGVASQSIYVCGWRSRAAGVATWFLENTASTNANCSSTNTQITGVATEAANTGETVLASFWSGLKNTSGNGLCINSTGTGGVDVDVWYAQF
jgi:hypothetical protein